MMERGWILGQATRLDSENGGRADNRPTGDLVFPLVYFAIGKDRRRGLLGRGCQTGDRRLRQHSVKLAGMGSGKGTSVILGRLAPSSGKGRLGVYIPSGGVADGKCRKLRLFRSHSLGSRCRSECVM